MYNFVYKSTENHNQICSKTLSFLIQNEYLKVNTAIETNINENEQRNPTEATIEMSMKFLTDNPTKRKLFFRKGKRKN